ncbi:MAG: TetR/AcrR family transcriptional regulator [Calditrichaeota bacterium]|nr:MAG: TetR/AcrR family transcriptional regulator [Calditrichota bacterium]
MATASENHIRRTILDVTRHLLVQNGISNLSMRMISRKVGCSVGTIYFYFRNKDALVHSLIEEGFELLISIMEQTYQTHHDTLERLKALCVDYIQFGLKNPEYYEIMFMLNPERMERYPAEKYRRARHTLELISETLAEATREKVLNVKEPYQSAHLIWTFMHGLVSLLLARRIDARLDQQGLIDSAIEKIALMFR